MRFGHFDDATREYVITTPATPRPWINYLGSEDFFGLISHTGGGYCFYRDARLRRLIRYRYNNVPTGAGGRCFYINDGGEVWSPAWAPVQAPLDHFECRHGLGYTTITGERRGIVAEALYLVPRGAEAEVHRLRLCNRTGAARSLQVFSFIEFSLWNALDDQTNYQRNLSTGEVEIEGSAIYHVTEYRERRDHYAVYAVNAPLAGFDTDRDAFFGPYRGWHEPEAVIAGRARDSRASGWAPIGSHQVDVHLSPGEQMDLVFVLGYCQNPPERKWERPGVVEKGPARDLLARFCTSEQVDRALADLRSYWDDLLGSCTVRSTDARVDRMANVWNQYQCLVTFNLSRSASYFESGIGRGMGFRDSCQDLLGCVHLVPSRARQRILDLAATQSPDGSVYHQYQPLTKRGNHEVGSGFNDDPLWLVEATGAYVRETGDVAILGELVPFDSDPEEAGTLFEHLRRSYHHVLDNLGPHGLPLIGRADWNDCLNLNCFSEEPDESFQTTQNRAGRTAESVFIAGLLVHCSPDYAALARAAGLPAEAAAAEERASTMAATVLAEGWDGEWFLRAFDYFGAKVGSRECAEGQIFVEPQGMCVMAGIGLEDGRARQALESVHSRLATAHGILLHQPAYTRYHLELGEITSYPPGYKENAGVFCHVNPWVTIGECRLGHGERAFAYWRALAPAFREEISEVHGQEPYVYAQMIAGRDSPREGEAKNSWLTGTAAWSWVALSQHILGIRPEWEGLRVEPCLPAHLREVQVVRRCRGATYRIIVDNQSRAGSPRLTVDGRAIRGSVVPYRPPGAVVVVRVRM